MLRKVIICIAFETNSNSLFTWYDVKIKFLFNNRQIERERDF